MDSPLHFSGGVVILRLRPWGTFMAAPLSVRMVIKTADSVSQHSQESCALGN